MADLDEIAGKEAAREWNLKEGDVKIPIWVDCDTGHDDAFALLLAASCPRFNLLGVSTVHGNASLENTTNNTLSVLKAIGRSDVQVFSGAAKPFCREAVHAESIHGETGLDGTTLLPKVKRERPSPQGEAIHAMYLNLITTPPQTAWLVTTGTLTNAALVFSIYPDLVNHLAGLSIMGGAIGGFFSNAPLGRTGGRLSFSDNVYRGFPGGMSFDSSTSINEFAGSLIEKGFISATDAGDKARLYAKLDEMRGDFGNWTPFAEFNIYADPEAAQAIFRNSALAAKTTLIPLDVTHQVLANDEMLQLLGLKDTNGRPAPTTSNLRRLFLEIISFFKATYEQEFNMWDGPPLHDPLAVAAALSQALFDDNGGERFDVYVITEGDDSITDHERNKHNVGQCGRTIARLLEGGKAGVRIPRTLDIRAFWHLIKNSLDVAEARSAIG